MNMEGYYQGTWRDIIKEYGGVLSINTEGYYQLTRRGIINEIKEDDKQMD